MSTETHPELDTPYTELHATDAAAPDTRRAHHQRNERGATAVEYALMVGLIAVAIIGSVSVLGNRIKSTFSTVDNSLTATADAPAASGWTNIGPGYVAPSGGIAVRFRYTAGVGPWSSTTLPGGDTIEVSQCIIGGSPEECQIEL
jgi:pilus assembly protein Flp/PilA